jgi:hypothetical protein
MKPVTILSAILIALGASAALVALAGPAWGQGPERFIGPRQYYQPLNARMPPGEAAYFKNGGGPPRQPYFQPFRVDLPTSGEVAVFHSGGYSIPLHSGGMAGLLVGHVYRLRLSKLPEFPGVEFYPTVEILDRLHPPPGRELHFPVPLEFLPDELASAAEGGFLTKVVYLEQPDLAAPTLQADGLRTATLPPVANLLAESDRVGRPMAIIRLGSRVPVGHPDPSFFGSGGRAIPLVPPLDRVTPAPMDQPTGQEPDPAAEAQGAPGA